jgi:hypothetical protein
LKIVTFWPESNFSLYFHQYAAVIQTTRLSVIERQAKAQLSLIPSQRQQRQARFGFFWSSKVVLANAKFLAGPNCRKLMTPDHGIQKQLITGILYWSQTGHKRRLQCCIFCDTTTKRAQPHEGYSSTWEGSKGSLHDAS